jgi:hypothetical protein
MERLVLASSNPGGLVADFFCGAGTTPLVASQHDRRFIASDISWRAIHTTRSRLISGSVQPFNLKIETSQELERHAGQANDIQLSDTSIHLKPDLLEELDFWEVDPNWDGQVFHSAGQALRPLKKGAIAGQLDLAQPVEKTSLALRMVRINGDQAQIIIPG